MLGSAKTNLSLHTLTSWVKGTSPFVCYLYEKYVLSGVIYTTGKTFTLPPAVTGVTNIISVHHQKLWLSIQQCIYDDHWQIYYCCYLSSVSDCSELSPCCLWLDRNIMTLFPKHKTTTHLRLSINIVKWNMTRKYTFEWCDHYNWRGLDVTLFKDSSRNMYETPQQNLEVVQHGIAFLQYCKHVWITTGR